LLAFAEDPEAALNKMPQRVQDAPHLGSALVGRPRTDVDDPRNARSLMDRWRHEARSRRQVDPTTLRSNKTKDGAHSSAPDGAGHPLVLTEFQSDWQKAAIAMRRLGVDA
jgi:hypothetical protein